MPANGYKECKTRCISNLKHCNGYSLSSLPSAQRNCYLLCVELDLRTKGVPAVPSVVGRNCNCEFASHKCPKLYNAAPLPHPDRVCARETTAWPSAPR